MKTSKVSECIETILNNYKVNYLETCLYLSSYWFLDMRTYPFDVSKSRIRFLLDLFQLYSTSIKSNVSLLMIVD